MSSLLTTISNYLRTNFPCLTFFFSACAFFFKSTAFLFGLDCCWKEIMSVMLVISIVSIVVLVTVTLCLCLLLKGKKKRTMMEVPMLPVVKVDEVMTNGNYKAPTVEEEQFM